MVARVSFPQYRCCCAASCRPLLIHTAMSGKKQQLRWQCCTLLGSC